MAIMQIRFTDLPDKQRRKRGEAMIREIRQSLLLPLPDEYKAKLEARIDEITAQMNGPQTSPVAGPVFQMPSAPPAEPPPLAPVHHVVTITEGLAVDDTLK